MTLEPLIKVHKELVKFLVYQHLVKPNLGLRIRDGQGILTFEFANKTLCSRGVSRLVQLNFALFIYVYQPRL